MKEKPDVLSDEEICAAMVKGSNWDDITNPLDLIKDGFLGNHHRAIAQAMLDKCMAYYEPLIQQAKEEVARGIRFEILEWFRNYAHQLDRRFPHPTVEEKGWLGNIWDMIHMAGKEDFVSKYLPEKEQDDIKKM